MGTLEGRYNAREAEPRLQEEWTAAGYYQFDPASTAPPFLVDTPPPTVSGRLHIGHVYSYTQIDVMVRYHRMTGEAVFYPFGFDDNGLPTERFTENSTGIRAREVGRQSFIEACLALSAQAEAQFERFWKRLGLSADWRLRYSTIDERSRRVSQSLFIDLYEKGLVYRQEAPALWCPECQTAVAQADVDDKQGVVAAFSTIPFTLQDGRTLAIATTRPELLPACVAVFVHPDDARYRSTLGGQATTPLFGRTVPVLADDQVDPAKGTGAVMCCTFGDLTDVYWWRTYGLPLLIVLTPDGRLNDEAGPYAGQRIATARATILADLAAAGNIVESHAVEHTVGVHERCGTPIEYLVTGQWFVRLLDERERFLEAGRQIRWHPEHMRVRYESWVAGLNWDWTISRQRFYGVPVPVWYCRACGQTVVAAREQLPVDPQQTGPAFGICPGCGGTEIEPDRDVLDTWATSSLTPQICATLLEPLGVTAAEFEQRYRPMTLRPNAHDIIRTWDFYTIVRSLYLRDQIPWTDVLIAGHALDPAGKKLSKSKLTTAEDPTAMVETFSADAVRYWATSVRTGGDTLLSDEVIKNGNRLATKLWNAARLALPHLDGYVPHEPGRVPPAGLNATDRWLLARLHTVIERATADMEEYEFAAARSEVERFFWADLCDNYLELVKFRLYGHDGDPDAGARGREGACYTLGMALMAVLKLLAPFMPHITDEIYRAGFATAEGAPSIHVARWPAPHEAWADREAERSGAAILEIAEAARRWKGERQLGVGTPLEVLRITCPADMEEALRSALLDLRSVTRVARIELAPAGEGSTLDLAIEGPGG